MRPQTYIYTNTLTNTYTIYTYISNLQHTCDVDMGLKYVFGTSVEKVEEPTSFATFCHSRIWQNEWIWEKVLDRHGSVCVCDCVAIALARAYAEHMCRELLKACVFGLNLALMCGTAQYARGNGSRNVVGKTMFRFFMLQLDFRHCNVVVAVAEPPNDRGASGNDAGVSRSWEMFFPHSLALSSTPKGGLGGKCI